VRPFRLLLLLLLAFAASSSIAGDIISIDKSLTDCLSKKENTSTSNMNKCIYKANDSLEQEMLNLYQSLARHLTGQAKIDLEASQKAWLAYRDAEQRSIASIFDNVQGSMYANIRAMDNMNITKNRATALNSYARAVGI
jgi:uncharacterized protein YecT (DUF1311 family)